MPPSPSSSSSAHSSSSSPTGAMCERLRLFDRLIPPSAARPPRGAILPAVIRACEIARLFLPPLPIPPPNIDTRFNVVVTASTTPALTPPYMA